MASRRRSRKSPAVKGTGGSPGLTYPVPWTCRKTPGRAGRVGRRERSGARDGSRSPPPSRGGPPPAVLGSGRGDPVDSATTSMSTCGMEYVSRGPGPARGGPTGRARRRLVRRRDRAKPVRRLRLGRHEDGGRGPRLRAVRRDRHARRRTLDETFAREPRLRTGTLAFAGAHLTPGAGNYAPLDFLEIGLAEKLERDLPFLLIVTEVDLSSSSLAYTLALPSQLTNVAVMSTRRLDPGSGETRPTRAHGRAARVADAALLRPPERAAPRGSPTNVMYRARRGRGLDRMAQLTADQLRRSPARCRARRASGRPATDKPGFVLRMLVRGRRRHRAGRRARQSVPTVGA